MSRTENSPSRLSTYIPNVSLTVSQAQRQYTEHGICRPWSGDAIQRHALRMREAHLRALMAEEHLNEVCS